MNNLFRPDEYTLLQGIESLGGGGSYGIKILVCCPSVDIENNKGLRDAGYKAMRDLTYALDTAKYAADPKTEELRAAERKELIGLFRSPIYVEEVENGYSGDPFYRRFPWYVVTTHVGRIKIGWRKRVIEIDWNDTPNAKNADDLFANENVTKDNKLIHAHNIKDAQRYLDTIITSANAH